MLNPIIQMLSQGSPNNGQKDIFMQAYAAMMRGETPQQFLKKLAETDPRLKDLDLTNPTKAAEDLCKQNGKDFNQEKAGIISRINQFLNK